MKGAAITFGALAILLLLALFASRRLSDHRPDPADVPPLPAPAATDTATAEALARANPGFIYGRVTTVDGDTHEGRLRFGRGEETFWGDYFNGVKRENNWIAQVPPGQLPVRRNPLETFASEFLGLERPLHLPRPFMTRFGDIARIEAQGRNVLVTLKSGTVFTVDRYGASDFDDTLRVWVPAGGFVRLASGRIRLIELLPTARLSDAPARLHGAVHTAHGDFTGFLQWDREQSLATDTLDGNSAEGGVSLPFDTIRSIARHSPESSLVTLRDGREILLSGTRKVGRDNRGVYVDDPRYGRVLVSWDAFDRLDFTPGGASPAYTDFPPGAPISGAVTTRAGQRLPGRLVFDLDESETTDTLDAPLHGVDYNLPFGLVASIVLPEAGDLAPVTLYNGEQLTLELSGDLDGSNAGLLVFTGGNSSPGYIPWADIARLDFDRPPAVYPPLLPHLAPLGGVPSSNGKD